MKIVVIIVDGKQSDFAAACGIFANVSVARTVGELTATISSHVKNILK